MILKTTYVDRIVTVCEYGILFKILHLHSYTRKFYTPIFLLYFADFKPTNKPQKVTYT